MFVSTCMASLACQ